MLDAFTRRPVIGPATQSCWAAGHGPIWCRRHIASGLGLVGQATQGIRTGIIPSSTNPSAKATARSSATRLLCFTTDEADA